MQRTSRGQGFPCSLSLCTISVVFMTAGLCCSVSWSFAKDSSEMPVKHGDEAGGGFTQVTPHSSPLRNTSAAPRQSAQTKHWYLMRLLAQCKNKLLGCFLKDMIEWCVPTGKPYMRLYLSVVQHFFFFALWHQIIMALKWSIPTRWNMHAS